MKSGLEGRNNTTPRSSSQMVSIVSMKSGLEGRNNSPAPQPEPTTAPPVSMKSGLEGRNNYYTLDKTIATVSESQ